MLHNEFDKEVENHIIGYFNSIKFSKPSNCKLFEKWKNNSSEPINFSGYGNATSLANSMEYGNVALPDLNTGDRLQRHTELLAERRLLANHLTEINQTLLTSGEDEAEKLLRKYTKTVPALVKYLSLAALFIMLWFFWKAISLD